MKPIKIVGLGGSPRAGSASTRALELALSGAREAGAEVELIEVHALALPMYAPGLDPTEEVRRYAAAVAEARGLLWSSPVYHGSISGVFKNALDWLELLSTLDPPYLTDKVVGLISTAGGVQGLQAVNTMEFVVRALRGFTYPLTVPVDRAGQALAVDESGNLRDPRIQDLLRRLGGGVAQAAARLSP